MSEPLAGRAIFGTLFGTMIVAFMGKSNPEISIVVPIHKNKATLNHFIGHLLGLRGAKHIEIIVVDGKDVEEVTEVLSNDRVKIVVAPKGRGYQMNIGAKMARGRILLFLHADTYLPPNAYEELMQVKLNDKVVGGAFYLGFSSSNYGLKVIAKCANWRSRLTRVPFGDQAIFVLSEYFERIGGYAEMPLMEDVELMNRIRKDRKKILFVPKLVRTSPIRWEEKGLLTNTFLNWILQLMYFFGVSPHKIARIYYGKS